VGVAGDTCTLRRRRVGVLTGLFWVPLLLLSVAEGFAWGGRVKVPFLHDVELHARLLLALPLLVVVTLVPVAPLLLTMFSLDQLLGEAMKMVF
jgi:hypothetical protein